MREHVSGEILLRISPERLLRVEEPPAVVDVLQLYVGLPPLLLLREKRNTTRFETFLIAKTYFV